MVSVEQKIAEFEQALESLPRGRKKIVYRIAGKSLADALEYVRLYRIKGDLLGKSAELLKELEDTMEVVESIRHQMLDLQD